MARAYTWEALAHATCRRQFPRVRGRGAAAVVDLVERVGPIQSQVARSPFVTASSRVPGVAHGAVTEAYESLGIVRGSNLRGTVHTSAVPHHRLLDAVTRHAMEKGWRRHLKLDRSTVADVQEGIEDFAQAEWRTPGQLREHLVAWLSEHEGSSAADAAATTGVGRAFAHVHSGLIRRPLGDGAWDRQTAPCYRTASEVLGEERRIGLDPAEALVALTRQHLRAFGPANRRDIAWWTGEGLTAVDAALATLADELTQRPGPGGQTYYDLVDAPTGGHADPGVRLLPEYDALIVGYDPKSRDRFLDPAHLPQIWMSANGMFSASVLADGQLAAAWKIVADGAARARSRIEVEMFPGVRRLRETDLADQVEALESVLGIEIADVAIRSPTRS
jgi:winged helix DNA-binding protein